MATTTIDTGKAKDIVIIAAIVIAIIILVPVIKSLANIGKGVGETVGTDILGVVNSDEKAAVNKIYNSGISPLFSNYFTVMQAKAPANAWMGLNSVDTNKKLADKLTDSIGYLFDDDDKAIAVFDNFPTQYAVAFFAKVFKDYKGSDLFYTIRKSDKLFAQGLKAETVYSILRKVQALPKY